MLPTEAEKRGEANDETRIPTDDQVLAVWQSPPGMKTESQHNGNLEVRILLQKSS